MKKQIIDPVRSVEPIFHIMPQRERTLRYTASVSRVLNERVLKEMGKLLDDDMHAPIGLFITCPGGQTGVAMSFYDTVHHVLKPQLTTIGSGDVDSSGIIIFLSGSKRYVTAQTSFLFHPAGRLFGNQRYTTREMEAMLREDRLKDEQYARVVADNSRGSLTVEQVLAFMEKHIVLAPVDMVAYRLADAILP